jgi:hypothetical protein
LTYSIEDEVDRSLRPVARDLAAREVGRVVGADEHAHRRLDVGVVRELASQPRPLEDAPEHLSARLDEASSELREKVRGVVLFSEDGPDHCHTERPLDTDPEVAEQGDEVGAGVERFPRRRLLAHVRKGGGRKRSLARVAQTLWTYGSELDFSDGVTSVIVLGSEVNAANAAWQAWADAGGSGPYPEVEVHNYAVDLGLVVDRTPDPS